MKNLKYKLIIPGALAMLVTVASCKKFLDKTPQGSLNTVVLANKAGVDGLLIGAYALTDGVFEGGPSDPWTSGTNNWVFGGVGADDAHKGSTPGDQPGAAQIESHTATSINGYLNPKFLVMLNGIQRANDVIREIPLVKDGSVSAAYAAQVTGEARFIRGFFHMENAKIWRNVPYIDETINYDNGNYFVANPGPIWDKIEADFAAAMAALPVSQPQAVGRANKYAAEAFLGKAYMFDHKYTQALAAFNDVITNGVTASGAKYALVNYSDNFNASTKNNAEGVFVIQASVHDGSNGFNGNGGDVLNFPSGGPATCCGFYQPSFTFVNSFKTDAVTGLPLFTTFNNSDLKNDQGVAAGDAYTPDSTTPLDSRLDWSVGRRGIPYLDWGVCPGAAWARDQADGGAYLPIKNAYYQAAAATTSDSYGGWAGGQSTANGYNAMRYSDVLLMAAECEIEVGSLANAEALVNRVRARAADPKGWVYKYASDANPLGARSTTPAANYKVGLYTGQFTAQGKTYARTAVQFERRIELGMEGHRFFDLQRWDGIYGGPMATGFMAGTINTYLAHENAVPNFPIALIKGAVFTQGRNELYPIPQGQIDVTQGAIKQNPGY